MVVRVSERIPLGDIELAYQAAGDGADAVAFVHGLGGSANAWRAQLEAAAEHGYRAIAHDARGAGRSSMPAGPYSVELWADDLVHLCDALGLERVALVGHSAGTMVAEHAALLLGERAWALALLGGALEWKPEARAGFEERARLARDGRLDEIAEGVATTGLSEACRRERPALHGLFVEMIASNDPEGYAESALATGPARMLDPGHVSCAALAFAGEHDAVTPPVEAEAIAAAIPGCELTTVAEAAHWCQVEAPDRVNEVLFAFLERARSRSVSAR
jgi:3-oxoadipate enol-lactonase